MNDYLNLTSRYNAEKTKVGMYYSTPVYQFRFKCVYCPTYIVMKTDPGVGCINIFISTTL